ncbi:MAG: hypothetical protein R2759_18740 [Bacteroidales bacterium]
MALQSNKKKAGQFKITIWILYCVIFFFICSFENLYSQVIIGTVHDCGNKKPIENANLHIKDNSQLGLLQTNLASLKNKLQL